MCQVIFVDLAVSHSAHAPVVPHAFYRFGKKPEFLLGGEASLLFSLNLSKIIAKMAYKAGGKVQKVMVQPIVSFPYHWIIVDRCRGGQCWPRSYRWF
jgi:hypothetical protein